MTMFVWQPSAMFRILQFELSDGVRHFRFMSRSICPCLPVKSQANKIWDSLVLGEMFSIGGHGTAWMLG